MSGIRSVFIDKGSHTNAKLRHNAKIAKPHCVFVPAARAAGCDLSVLLYDAL